MKHVPVLLKEIIEAFSPLSKAEQDVIIMDGTLGGAGHTHALLETYSNLRVLGCDVDESAILRAKQREKNFVEENRLDFFHGSFSKVVDHKSQSHINPKFSPSFAPPWNGILLDLGYSSTQLDDPQFGLSFQKEGPLDMRLNRPPMGYTAWDLLCDSSDEELADIFQAYGEIPNARSLAKTIHTAIRNGLLENSTLKLAKFIEKRGSLQQKKIHPATLVFQALRIAVNDELRELDDFLKNAILNLRDNGRLLIITFHSLEDRIVKSWARQNSSELELLWRKPIIAGAGELEENPRARSAKLRGYEIHRK